MTFKKCSHGNCENSAVFFTDYCYEHYPDKEELRIRAKKFIDENTVISGVNFSGINLDDTDFSLKKILYSSFSSSSLRRVKFDRTFMISVFMDFSDFEGAVFNKVNIKLSVFAGANFIDSKIEESTIVFCNFLGVNIKNITFNNTDLSHTRFISSINDGAGFVNCNLKKTVFDKINFNKISLKTSNCEDSIKIVSFEPDLLKSRIVK